MIRSNEEVVLSEEDKIRLANEEFVFHGYRIINAGGLSLGAGVNFIISATTDIGTTK